VAEKRLETGELVVVQGGEHPRLYAPALLAVAPSWISGEAPEWPLRCQARLRHRQPLQDCLVQPVDDNLLVSFDQPQRAIAPGQFAVLYAGETCLGGAVIQRALPSPERLADSSATPLTLA
jgi:tRNA-specific 2-thiouridylase